MMDLRTAARALGGEVSGRGIVCPGFGHSPRDRSLSVLFSPSAPGGFLVRSHAGDDDMAAKDWVRQRLGLGGDVRAAVSRTVTTDVVGKHRITPEHNGLDEAERTRRALALWNEARHPVDSPVARHLAHRGVGMPADPREVIRFHPACPFAGTRTRAMVALVRDVVTNKPVAIHRTALDLGGHKIEVDGKDRLALGPIAGGAIKLTADENVTTCLGIGEGIETTLSLQLLPEFALSPAWALISAAGITNFPVLPGIEVLWIAADNDPAGRGATEHCARRWRDAGREVVIVTPTRLQADLNDVVREAAHG